MISISGIVNIGLPQADVADSQDVIDKSLYCYGMEFKCRKEAERSTAFGGGGEYALRLELAADDFLKEARRLRRLCDA